MISTDYPEDLKKRLRSAIACSFAGCLQLQEYSAVTSTVVEFLTAFEVTAEEVEELFSQADGMDADTDRCIDEIIEAFNE